MIAHLFRFDLPLILAISILMGLFNPQPQWWQVTIIMIGAAIWDWGWHSKIHHPEIWSAHILIRMTGASLALSIPLITLYSL